MAIAFMDIDNGSDTIHVNGIQPFAAQHVQWNLEHPNLMIAAPHIEGFNDDSEDSDDDPEYNSSDESLESDEDYSSSEGDDSEPDVQQYRWGFDPSTPLPCDYHRHWLRCHMRDHDGYAPAMMHEAAELEQQHSAFGMQRIESRRSTTEPIKYSHDGFVMLGTHINLDLISTAEEEAAVLNSSFMQSENSIDYGSDSHDEEMPTPLPTLAVMPTLAAPVQPSITAFTQSVSVNEHQALYMHYALISDPTPLQRRAQKAIEPAWRVNPQTVRVLGDQPHTDDISIAHMMDGDDDLPDLEPREKLQPTDPLQNADPQDSAELILQRVAATALFQLSNGIMPLHTADNSSDDSSDEMQELGAHELSTNADDNHNCYCQYWTSFDGMCTRCMQCTGVHGCCNCTQRLQDFH
jgi:hypothetical protein